MIKNYFVTAINNLIKNKLYSAINIVGLAIGLAACILIALYIQDETSYDKHWKNADRIYRVISTVDLPGVVGNKFAVTALPALPALRRFFPEDIELGTRIYDLPCQIIIDNSRFEEGVAFVDPDIVKMFDINTLAGNLEHSIKNASSIALSAKSAEKFFGNTKDAIGKTMTATVMGFTMDVKVGAVYKLPEGNTMLDIPAMAYLNDKLLPPGINHWLAHVAKTYVQFKPGVDVSRIRSQLPEFTDRNVDISFLNMGPKVKSRDKLGFELQNITEQYMNSPFDGQAGGNRTIVGAFTAISFLVLLIGSINFIILTTAKATQRAREVAMRKVLGAKRRQLVFQFMGESFLIVLFSMMISLAAVELVLPFFDSLVGKSLKISYSSPFTYFALAALLLVVSFIGGLYPAFVLSHFRPARTLKANRSVETKGSTTMRNALVFVQFSISIALIAATAVVYLQVQYAGSRDPGFNKENLLVINNSLDRINIAGKRETLKQEIAALPNIRSVCLSNRPPMSGGQNHLILKRQGAFGESQWIDHIMIDSNFFKTYQISLIAGRDYEPDRDPIADSSFNTFERLTKTGIMPKVTKSANLIINMTAARRLGFSNAEEAVGSQIIMNDKPFATIIGVVADANFEGMRIVPKPKAYIFYPDNTCFITVRFHGDPSAVQTQVGKIWKSITGDGDMRSFYVDQLMVKEFEKERVEAQVLVSFSLLAIIIACLGLFGSASFAINRRTLEIGMRKVMGAKVKDIVRLLLWQFSRPVLLANLLAWPLAMWIMLRWLERFPYRIDAWVLALLCVLSGLIVLAIAWLTVAGNTMRVARANPIHSLRYE